MRNDNIENKRTKEIREKEKMSKVDIINWVVSQIRTRDDSNKYGDVNTATLALLQTINNNSTQTTYLSSYL